MRFSGLAPWEEACFCFSIPACGKEHRRRVAMTVPLIRIKTSELRCSYTTVATFVGLSSGSSGQKSINILTQVYQPGVLGRGLMSEDARGLSVESAKAVVCVSGCPD